MRRTRKGARSSLREESNSNDRIKSIYFDGRKDVTKVTETVHSKMYEKCVTEEHVSLVQEPGSEYFGHISPVTAVLPKLGCRGPLKYTKSGTILLNKCILSNFSQEKKSKSGIKSLKQKFGKH